MHHPSIVSRSTRIRGLFTATLLWLLCAITASAQLTWDANTSLTGVQNTDGTTTPLIWNTTNLNWWDGTKDVAWVNGVNAIAQFGSSIPTPAVSNPVSITEDIVLKEMRFFAVTTGTVGTGQPIVLNGDVAGRQIDFGTDGLIQLEDRSSGGSPFGALGSNLRIKSNNLRIQKYGTGTAFNYFNFNMSTNPNLTGTLTVGGSIYLGLNSFGTVQNVSRIVVEAGGTIVTAGSGGNYTVPFTLAGYGNSLLNTSTAYGAIRMTANNVTLSGGILLSADAGINTSSSSSNATGIIINAPITDNGGNYSFSHIAFNGNGTMTLAAANTYGGATILGKSSVSYTGSITILDFTASTSPQNDILYNGLTTPGGLVLNGGVSVSTLRLTGADLQTHSQRFGNVTVSGTAGSIELLAGVGGMINMKLGTVTQTTATATLAIYNPLATNLISTTSNGFIGPWASYTGELGRRSWAQGVGGQLTSGYVGSVVYATGGSLSTSPFSSTANATIDSTSTGTVTLGTGVTLLNTLSMNDLANSRQVGLGTGQTLRLGVSSGIQIVNGALNLTVGISGQTSTLSAGGSVTNTTGTLFLSNLSDTSTLTINSNIANNGTSGTVTLVVNGAPNSRTILTGTNTYTGGTRVDSGILEIRSSGALGTSGTVTLTEAAGATLGLSGGITLNRALAGMSGMGDGGNGAIRSLSGSNTISALITQVASTFIVADAGASLTISAATASTTAIDGSFPLIFGGAGTITVSGRLNIGTSNGSGGGSMTKTGTGTLILSGDNSYAGATTVSSGTLKLASTTALGATAGVTISAGATIDLNGQTTDRAFSSINGTGVSSLGALINSSGTTAVVTGTTALATATTIGGSGNITISNATGLTGSVLLTKIGTGTLTVIDSTTTSTRTGTNQIDAGTLRIQATTAIAPIGTGSYALNGGTLSMGFDVANPMTNVVNVISSSTIIADRASAGAGSFTETLSTLTIGGSTLTVKPGDNVTSGTMGLTFGSVSIGGVSMKPGNPVFDVQSTANAALTLTLGALGDQAIAPRTITFQNSGAAASTVVLATAASLVDGTIININNGTNAGVTVNLNIAAALGSLSQVNVYGNSTLTAGVTSIVLGSLGGSGTVNATGAFTLTIGNAASATLLNSNFSGVLANGTGTLTLTKAGLGTLTLSGSTSNTFTGATTVAAGTLVLAKTGGASAVTAVLNIGNAAASTTGNATVRLDGDNQIAYALAGLNDFVTINAGGTLDLNGHLLTVNSFAGFGATVSGSGALAVNRTGGSITFGGISTISSTVQLTTAGSGSATRSFATTNVTDQLTISGSLTESAGVSGLVAKTFLGTVILSGNNSYTGTTTVSAGILNIRSANALGTTASGTSVTSGATLQIQGGITTLAEALTLSGGSGFAGSNGINIQTGALVNVSGVNNYTGLLTLSTSAVTISSDSGTLNLTNTGTITGATFNLTLAGAGDGSISSIIGTTTGGVIKNGTGTWTLKGVNTSTGAIVINVGTLKVGDGTTGKWSSAPGLTYTGSGSFEYGGATAFSTQALGALTLTSGYGILQVDAPASGTNTVSFTSLVAPAFGSGLNIVSPANTAVTITGSANTNGIIDPRLTYNGVDFAASTAGTIGAAATTPATSSMAAGNTTPYLISGSFTQSGSTIINAGIKFAGGDTLTIGNGTLLTINNGNNTAGGILVTGGVAAVIANEGSATGLTTGGSGDLVIGTNASGDSLSIQVVITSGTTGGLTKNGAGTLTLTVANAYTGATSINAGTLVIGNAGALSTSAATVQVGAVLDLNGKVIINTAVLNGTGSGTGALINNSATAASIGALTIGLGNGTGGIGASIGGTGNITSTGALSGNNILVKTGTGTLTLGDNAGTAQASTRTAATRIDSGILRISNSTSALGTSAAAIILNGGTLSLGSTASVVAYPVSVTASSSIISDVYTAGAGLTHTLGVLAIGTQTLTIQAGANVTTGSTNAGVAFGATTLTGSPTFDVQSPTTASNGTTTLTLGALSDQGVAKTITFSNSGTSTTNSIVILNAAMASLVDGTIVNINSGTKAGVTLNLSVANALGTLAQVTVNGKSILNIGAAQTIGSLAGNGTVTASGTFTLTVGNANTATPLNTNFTGVLSNGTGTLALTKNGLGTLTLSGASTYTGLTTVSLGILKLNNATALGATSGVTISVGGTVDLNGQTTDRNFSSVSGTGHNGGGAIINSSSTMSTITGTLVLGAVAKIGGSGDIFVNNAGGITGNALLTKFGSGTLTFTSVSASARSTSGTNQIDEGTLRLQAATVITPVGLGAFVLNGGTLSLGYDSSGSLTNAVNVLSNSTIIADRASSGTGGLTFTLGTVITAGSTLTVKPGSNVTSGTMGLTFGSITIGGPSLAPGDPVFDVQSTANAAMTLTLGALTDQAIAPRTITFQNSGTAASSVILATAATSLVDGTMVNLASTGGAVTVNANITNALGTFAQVTVGSGNTFALGASQTIAALNGTGTVTTTIDSTLTIGNVLSPTVTNSTFNGVLAGSGLSVVKSGQGSLTLGGSASNTYSGTGTTVINSGTLILAKTDGAVAIPNNLTLGSVNGTSGTATAQLNASEQIASTASVTVNAGSSMNLNGYNQTLGNLNGTPGSTILNNATSTSSTLTIGANDASGGQFMGSIADNSGGTGTVALTKTGLGTALLGGYNSYSGATIVQSGTLQVGAGGVGTTGVGAVTVQNIAAIIGTGVVQGASFTAASGSTIVAGDDWLQSNYGTLTFKPASGSGAIDFQAGSTIVLGINTSGTSDLLNIVGTGTNTLMFNGDLQVTADSFTPSGPMTFNLIDWSGLSASPTFASRYTFTGLLIGNGDEASGLDLPDLSGTGYFWDISNLVINGTILLAPEPSRVMLLGMSLGLLFLRRRRAC